MTAKEKKLKSVRDYNRRVKLETFEAYGGKCVCCEITDIEFLTIDHVNGGGRKHVDSLSAGTVYPWLKRNGFPQKEFRLLCMNCNFSLGKFGYCPHAAAGKRVNDCVDDTRERSIYDK